jgi:thiol-disulfide isomerase/thioredoxin
MLIITVLLSLALSIIFGVAGIAKLLDRPGTRDAVVNFGAPATLAGSLSLLLPFAEIAIALGLLLAVTVWGSALAALLLLGVFIVAIGVNLSRGRTPDCHCFGQLYSRPLGWPTLVRNMVFAVCAGFVVWLGPQTGRTLVLAAAEKLGGGVALSLIEFLGVAILVTSIVYFQQKRVLRNKSLTNDEAVVPPSGLPLGTVAPAFRLPAYRRDATSLAELLEPSLPLLLIFSNPKCGPCNALFGELAEWQRTYPDQVTVAVITQGTIKDNFVNIARNDLQNILFQNEREIAEQYQAIATPTGIMVSPDGLIASLPAPGAENIRALVDLATNHYGGDQISGQTTVLSEPEAVATG